MIKWHKATDKLPPKDKDVLVFVNEDMGVYSTDYFDLESRAYDGMPREYRDSLRKSVGRFKDYGNSYRFDDPNVYWAELPEGPKESN